MNDAQHTLEVGLYAYPFNQLVAVWGFVSDDYSAASRATLIDENVWTLIQTEDGKRIVKEWCDLHRLDLRQLAACPPDEDWSPSELANLTHRAGKVFENLLFRVRVVQKIGKSAARYSKSRGD